MSNEMLRERIDNLVWDAFHAGMSAGNPMTSTRARARMEADLFNELSELLSELND
jgi:hypothetical protein